MKNKLLLGSLLVLSSVSAYATPTLQLDIANGAYNWGDESVVTNSNSFNLYAYALTANGSGTVADFSKEYYVSIAILGQGVSSTTDFGSFVFDGITYSNDTSSSHALVYGAPPLDDVDLGIWDSGDLQKHGVFPTLYTQTGFYFDTSKTRNEVNVQDTPGTPISSGDAIAYQGFTVDTSGMKSGYELHFDLYNEDIIKSETTGDITNVDVGDFAPFSHDAETVPSDIPVPPQGFVPEPQTLALFGLGLIGLIAARRKIA